MSGQDIKPKARKPGPYIAGFLLLVLVFLALFVTGGLILSTDGLLSYKYAPYRTAIGLILLTAGLGVLAGAVVFMIRGMRKMADNLDLIFGHLGLESEGFRRDGKHYFGNIEGRRVDIYCHPITNRRYFGDVKIVKNIGHTLDIYCSARSATRGSVGVVREGEDLQGKIRSNMIRFFSTMLIEKYGGEIVKIEDDRFADYAIYALDPDWMRSFLDDPGIYEPLQPLLGEEIKCIRQHVHVIPAAIHFTAFTGLVYLRPEKVSLLVESLGRIAGRTEELPPAKVIAEETEEERKRRLGE